ncbi:hypothetical protein BLNAU_13387 [Blattamonas nauphoetae]|uniref:CCHC-type domain-containing protein n=1 Tax=Blattamonas nauphoetae TaxID=2049346 RepID=A0ABQ9XJX7_9EUKA|nr:hypothetical protein BLNAU_13387 [Blattamonas nauphoetae]
MSHPPLSFEIPNHPSHPHINLIFSPQLSPSSLPEIPSGSPLSHNLSAFDDDTSAVTSMLSLSNPPQHELLEASSLFSTNFSLRSTSDHADISPRIASPSYHRSFRLSEDIQPISISHPGHPSPRFTTTAEPASSQFSDLSTQKLGSIDLEEVSPFSIQPSLADYEVLSDYSFHHAVMASPSLHDAPSIQATHVLPDSFGIVGNFGDILSLNSQPSPPAKSQALRSTVSTTYSSPALTSHFGYLPPSDSQIFSTSRSSTLNQSIYSSSSDQTSEYMTSIDLAPGNLDLDVLESIAAHSVASEPIHPTRQIQSSFIDEHLLDEVDSSSTTESQPKQSKHTPSSKSIHEFSRFGTVSANSPPSSFIPLPGSSLPSFAPKTVANTKLMFFDLPNQQLPVTHKFSLPQSHTDPSPTVDVNTTSTHHPLTSFPLPPFTSSKPFAPRSFPAQSPVSQQIFPPSPPIKTDILFKPSRPESSPPQNLDSFILLQLTTFADTPSKKAKLVANLGRMGSQQPTEFAKGLSLAEWTDFVQNDAVLVPLYSSLVQDRNIDWNGSSDQNSSFIAPSQHSSSSEEEYSQTTLRPPPSQFFGFDETTSQAPKYNFSIQPSTRRLDLPPQKPHPNEQPYRKPKTTFVPFSTMTPALRCFRCGKSGHHIDECPQNQSIPDSASKFTQKTCCYKCGESGHISKDCPNEDSRICFHCRQTGHVMRDCPLKKADEKAGRRASKKHKDGFPQSREPVIFTLEQRQSAPGIVSWA